MTVIKQYNNSTNQWEEVLFGAIGPQGPKGDIGNTGPQGPSFPGGTKGQVLSKASNTNYDYSWTDRQYKNAVDIREFQDNIAVGMFDTTYSTVTDITPAIKAAFGVLNADGTAYVGGQTPQLTQGDTLVFPKGFYKCQPFSYSFPVHIKGSGDYLTRLAPVSTLHVDGTTTATSFINVVKGFQYVYSNHVNGSFIEDLFIDGRGRTIDIAGLEYQYQNRFLLRHVRIAHFARSALILNKSIREAVLDYVYLLASGDGSSYPQFDISDTVASDDTNNMHFRNLFSVYPFGDNIWIRPNPATGSISVRNLYFSESMLHNVASPIDSTALAQDGYAYKTTPSIRGGTALTLAGSGSVFVNNARFVNSSYGKPSIRACDFSIDSGYSNETDTVSTESKDMSFNTYTYASPGSVINCTGHGLTTGTRVKISKTPASPPSTFIPTIPTPFSTSKYYFVIDAGVDSLKLASSYEGAITGSAISYPSKNITYDTTPYKLKGINNSGAYNYLHLNGGNMGQVAELSGTVTFDTSNPYTITSSSNHNLTTGARIRFTDDIAGVHVIGGVLTETDYFAVVPVTRTTISTGLSGSDYSNTTQIGEIANSPTTFGITTSYLSAEWSAKHPSDTSRLVPLTTASCTFNVQRHYFSIEQGSLSMQEIDFDGNTDNGLIRTDAYQKIDIGKGIDFAGNAVLPDYVYTTIETLPWYWQYSPIGTVSTSTSATSILITDTVRLSKNAEYTFEGTMYVTGNVAADIKLQFVYNNINGLKWYASGIGIDGTTFTTSDAMQGADVSGSTGTVIMGTKSLSTPSAIAIRGTFSTTSVSPNLYFKFAQNVSSTDPTSLQPGSNLTFTRIS